MKGIPFQSVQPEIREHFETLLFRLAVGNFRGWPVGGSARQPDYRVLEVQLCHS
jgi:hypothetical protein